MSKPSDTELAPHDADAGRLLPEHLYVHVPLCASKCSYCDFFSLEAAAATVPPYEVADALFQQAAAWLSRGLEPRPLRTLYIGGGTPSVLGSSLPRLVDRLSRRFGLAPGAEVTIEANPDSLDRALVLSLAEVGVTRVSVGVQSLDDGELALLGRIHSAAEAVRAAAAVREAGLGLSVDVMCGLPGQGLPTFLRTLEGVVATGAEHVSVYPLALEAGTPLAIAALLGDVETPDPDLAADLMLAAEATLVRAGFERYEVANYARPGARSVHNTAYWTGREYLGVGPGAHGMLGAAEARSAGIVLPEGADVARVRYAVVCDVAEGLTAMPRVDLDLLDTAEAAREDVMLGLRLSDGVPEDRVRRAEVAPALARLATMGLVELTSGRWRLTRRGWLLGNEVFTAVWTAE